MQQTTKRVMIDADGVLLRWSVNVLTWKGIDTAHPDIERILHEEDFVAFEALFEGRPGLVEFVETHKHELWTHIPKYSWADKLVEMVTELCKEYGAKCAFLTSFSDWPFGAAGRIIQLEREYPHIPIVLTKRKEFCACSQSVLIDDFARNIKAFELAGGKTIKVDFPERVEAAGDWQEKILDPVEAQLKAFLCGA
jgi:hypothetical protein